MRSSKKKRQRSFFSENSQTSVPILTDKQEGSTQTDFTKRRKQQHDNNLTYLTCFDSSMRNYISTVILSKIKNSKKIEAGLLKAKNDMLNKARLPPGIMTNAASFAGLEASVMRSFMKNNAQKLMIDLWKDYVNEHFDTIAKTLKEKNLSFENKESSSSSIKPGSSEEVHRTFSISLNKVLRKDLPEDVETAIKTKIEASLKNASDFCAHFLFIINAMSIVIKNANFIKKNDKLILEKSTGFNILQILPPEFAQKNNVPPICSSLPLPRDIPEEYQKELEVLFTEQHLSLVQSHIFGSGAQQKNLDRHPVENCLFKELASNGITKDSYETMLKTEEKKVALTRIITSIKNMWSTSNTFTKLLDHLLDVLLKLHLAGNRTSKYNAYAAEKAKNKPTKSNAVISSNRRRNLISIEYKKKQKREQKLQMTTDKEKQAKYKNQISKNDQRIDFFRKLNTHKVVLVRESIFYFKRK